MAVMLPNAQLRTRTRAHPMERDAHGLPVGGATTPTVAGPFPGAISEPDDTLSGNQQYRLRLDPQHWPLRADDEVLDGLDRVFVVRTARLVTVPGDASVDFIRVNADLTPPVKP